MWEVGGAGRPANSTPARVRVRIWVGVRVTVGKVTMATESSRNGAIILSRIYALLWILRTCE